MIVSAAIVAAGVGSALGGALSDVAGRKRALLLADVLFTLGALGMGLAWDVSVLIAGTAVHGETCMSVGGRGLLVATSLLLANVIITLCS